MCFKVSCGASMHISLNTSACISFTRIQDLFTIQTYFWLALSCYYSSWNDWNVSINSILCFFFLCFLEPHIQHMKVPRLGAELVLQLPATATVTAIQDLSLVCDLHSSSWQHRIPGPLSEGREWTCILTDICWICFCWATTGTPSILWFYWFPLKLVQVRSR